MRLYASDSSFAVGGQHYEGFPILVDSAGVVVEVVLRFFVSELLGRAGANDRKTWDAYGRHLYDYFGYLEAKGLRWDRIPQLDGGDVSPLAHYVHWCHSTVGNLPGYVNDKRGTVERFYVWALKAGLINELPSSKVEEPSQGGGGRLVNAAAGPGRRLKSKLHVADPKALLPVLTRSQIETVLKAATNATHREMLHLGLNAGLRAEELTTFPKHYVVDCRNLPDKVKTVSVRLSPNDMDTKNSKARTVRVSVVCMNRLWQYREAVRPRLRAGEHETDALFLTRFGRPFVADGLVAPLARLGQRVGFHLHPHMLRHTFATHTLASLEDLKRAGRLKSSPLVLLKSWLGHTSVTQTSRYLHHLDAIEDVFGTRYQAEIDDLVLGYIDEKG